MSFVRHISQARLLRMESLESRQMLAADLELLKDLDPGVLPIGYEPQHLAEMNGVVYFSANNGAVGRELWRSDGTAEGTFLLKDLASVVSSNPRYMTNVDGVLYFVAKTNGTEHVLWTSDGTPEGTTMVPHLSQPYASGGFGNLDPLFTKMGDRVVYRTSGELWSTDGTIEGTAMIKEIAAGINAPNFGDFEVVDGRLYFAASVGRADAKVWTSDGTAGGTYPVPVLSSEAITWVSELTAFDGAIYLRARGINGWELWKTDPVSNLMVEAIDLVPGLASGYPENLTVLGDSLYFIANRSGNQILKWRAGELAPETVLQPTSQTLANLTASSGLLYYSLDGGVWQSDGNAGSGVLIAQPDAPASGIRRYGDSVYFFTETSGGRELWSSPGNPEEAEAIFSSTNPTFDVNSNLVPLGAAALFVGQDETGALELWRTSGTISETAAVVDRVVGVDGKPRELTRVGEVILFSGVGGLWRTDGTEDGTWLVKNLEMASQALSYVLQTKHLYSVEMGGFLYFVARGQGAIGYQLWRSDGTTTGTQIVKTINSGGDAFFVYSSSSVGDRSPHLINVGGLIYFRATDGINGLELWRSDGTAEGTFQLTNAPQQQTPFAWGQYYAPEFVGLNGELYFRAHGGTNPGTGLWKTNGTIAGTIRINQSAGVSYYFPQLTTAFGDSVYFVGSAGSGTSYGMWRVNGPTGEISLVKDLWGEASGLPSLCVAGNFLYFTARLTSNHHELWRTNGEPGHSELVMPAPMPDSQIIQQLVAVGDELYFIRQPDWYGELWKIGDSASAPTQVALLGDDEMTLHPSQTGPLYISGLFGTPSRKFYVSDGLGEGTQLAYEIPGIAYGRIPTSIIEIDGRLVIASKNERYGSELWSIGLPAAPIAGDFDRNGQVDGADFLRWQRTFGANVNYAGAGADADANRQINGDDLPAWTDNFGATPPPALTALEEQPLALSVAAFASSLAPSDEVEDEVLAEFATYRSALLTWFLTFDSLQSWRPRVQAEDPADLVWLTAEDSPSAPNSAVSLLRNPSQTLPAAAKAMRKKITALDEAESSFCAAWDAVFDLF